MNSWPFVSEREDACEQEVVARPLYDLRVVKMSATTAKDDCHPKLQTVTVRDRPIAPEQVGVVMDDDRDKVSEVTYNMAFPCRRRFGLSRSRATSIRLKERSVSTYEAVEAVVWLYLFSSEPDLDSLEAFFTYGLAIDR